MEIKTAICAIARNENRYIKEWCEYHLNLGFDYIEIFDNNDMNGEEIENEVSSFEEKVRVNRRFRGKTDRLHQSEAYTLFYTTHKEYDWIAFIDIDEFIFLENEQNIKGFLSEDKFKNADGVRLCWKCFTDSGLVTVENENYSVSRFTEYSDINSTQAKTIIRGGLPYIKAVAIHSSHYLKNAVDATGKKCWNGTDMLHHVNIGTERVWDCAYIKHYRFKTIQEFVEIKMKNWHQKNIKSKWISFDAFFKLNKKTEEKTNFIKKTQLKR